MQTERLRRLPPLPPWVSYVLLGMIIFSLLLHLLTWVAILQFRTLAREQVIAIADQVREAQQGSISANINVSQNVPIDAVVPVKKQLNVPIETSVSIDDQVTVPLAGIDIPVPIKADVPIKTTVPIDLDESVTISTTVALNLNVPIDVPIAGTSLASYLQQFEADLRALAQRL